jgi:hypothetical protein
MEAFVKPRAGAHRALDGRTAFSQLAGRAIGTLAKRPLLPYSGARRPQWGDAARRPVPRAAEWMKICRDEGGLIKLRDVVVLITCVTVMLFQPSASAGTSQPCATSIGSCPIIGCSGSNNPQAPVDRELNTRKNRELAQIPSQKLGPYDVNQFRDPTVLPTHAPKGNPKDLRSSWGQGDVPAENVRATENNEAALIGYILRAKLGDAESCNCDIATRDVVDTHINVVEDANTKTDPSELLGASVIAEITHRIRDPAWTLQALNAMALATQDGRPKPRVRIIGALTYDNLHGDMLKNGTRGTLWEVHPIREIDVEVNGHWVPFTGKNGSTAPAYTTIVRLLTTPPNALTTQHVQGNSLRFTNARYVQWSPRQIRALDARMVPDSS